MKTNVQLLLSIVIPTLVLSGCTKGSVSTSGGGPTARSIGSLKAYPTASGSSWTPITSGSRTYVKGLDLSVEGSCSTGVYRIKVDGGSGLYSETALCDINGKFVWTRSYTGPEEGDRTLSVRGFDIGDVAIADATSSIDVRVDNTAPSAPAFTTPASSPFVFNGASAAYVIYGTVASDVVSLSGPAGVAIAPSSGAWNFGVTLVDGATRSFSFMAYDLAGNISPAATQVISWSPTLSLMASGSFFSVGARNDLVSNFSIEATGETKPLGASHPGSGFSLLSGFNSVINQVRTD